MSAVIFYSWQSDLPNKTNRAFIGKALENVAKRIRNDGTISVEPRIEHDTTGLPGSPNIITAIFKRIDHAEIVVCDVSLINPDCGKRRTPNPNVMYELGYALKGRGEERILMVMNTAFGEREDLPFDIDKNRVTAYYLSEDATEKTSVRQKLEEELEKAIRTIFTHFHTLELDDKAKEQSPLVTAATYVREQRVDRISYVRKSMSWITAEIKRRWPPTPLKDFTLADLLPVLESTLDFTTEFAQLCEVTSETNDEGCSLAIAEAFGEIIELYNPERGNDRSVPPSHHDLARFLGHELFVTLMSFLVRDKRWSTIGSILGREIYVNNVYDNSVSYRSINEQLYTIQLASRFEDRHYVKLYGDILHKRHSAGRLAELVPISAFSDADFFLAVCSITEDKQAIQRKWRPLSAFHVNPHIPRYLAEARRSAQAVELLKPLGVSSLEDLRPRLIAARDDLEKYMLHFLGVVNPLQDVDISGIASK